MTRADCHKMQLLNSREKSGTLSKLPKGNHDARTGLAASHSLRSF